MKTLPLSIKDLTPHDSILLLSGFPSKPLTLSRWSLRVKAWALEKYTPKGLQEIFDKQDIVKIAEIAFFMLREKECFADIDAFMESVVTAQDQINLVTALLEAVGIGEPQLKEIEKVLNENVESHSDPKVQAPKKKIGAKPSTP